MEQWRYLWADVRRLVNRDRRRWLTVWFGDPFLAVCGYRSSRALMRLFGPLWPPLWVLTRPLAFLVRPWWGVADIHPQAAIGPGLLILHPRLGVVISARAVIGANLTLVGGNCIGSRLDREPEPIQIGAGLMMGANSSIIGPVTIGTNCRIGAGAVVVRDLPDDCTAVGVPAAIKRSSHSRCC